MAIDGNLLKDGVTGSWVIMKGNAIVKAGGKIRNGSGPLLSANTQRVALLFLLQMLKEIISKEKQIGGCVEIFIYN